MEGLDLLTVADKYLPDGIYTQRKKKKFFICPPPPPKKKKKNPPKKKKGGGGGGGDFSQKPFVWASDLADFGKIEVK